MLLIDSIYSDTGILRSGARLTLLCF